MEEVVEMQLPVIGEGVIDRSAMLAPIVAHLLLDEVAAGRWEKRPDGELVPVDIERVCVVQ